MVHLASVVPILFCINQTGLVNLHNVRRFFILLSPAIFKPLEDKTDADGKMKDWNLRAPLSDAFRLTSH